MFRLFFSKRSLTSSASIFHENPLGLPRTNAPPTMPRMQRGLPQKRGIPNVKQILVVASGKGGVGKSSVSVNLALALASLPGRPRIGLLDLDVYGPSIPKLMALEKEQEPGLSNDNRLLPLESHGIPCMSMGFLMGKQEGEVGAQSFADTPVAWRGMMVMKAVQQLIFNVDWSENAQKGDLDVLVLDTPPGTGDVHLSIGQLLNVDGSVIVTSPQDVAIADTRKGVAAFKKLGIPILGAVLNMSQFMAPLPAPQTPHFIFGSPTQFYNTCTELSLEPLVELEIIPEISQRGDSGLPIVLKKHSTQPTEGESRVRNAYLVLAEKVMKKMRKEDM